MEFQHLMRLMQFNQFDTIYHEHFSYLSLLSAEKIFEAHGLRVFDVEEIPTHGGSLRVFVKHAQETVHIAERILQSHIAHHSTDHRTLKIAREPARRGENVEELIAVHAAPQLIHHHHSIAVAVERQTDLGTHARHRKLQ